MNKFHIEERRSLDHPIFSQSIQYIRSQISTNDLTELQSEVLERLIHTSGDFQIQSMLRFSNGACDAGLLALKSGAVILVDTSMAASAVVPMASRTLNSKVQSVLDWAPKTIQNPLITRTSIGIKNAWIELTSKSTDLVPPVVVIGSSPSALQTLLDLIEQGSKKPSLIIGMPVGFIGVRDSKRRLLESDCSYIVIKGSRGGAALAAACVNALLRKAFIG